MTIYHPVSGALTVPPDGFAICNSRGRRVSLLNDDNSPYIPRHEQRSTPQPCPSPSMKFNSEPPSEVPYSSNVYSAPSPHTVMSAYDSTSPQLPHVHDLISFTFPNYDSQEENRSRNSSISSVSKYSRRDSMASSGSRQTSRDNSAQYKPSKRRYECTTCGKTFTTSGHVARHNRIHTGEKNFQCPEPGCSQRFSRQDNCMYTPARCYTADISQAALSNT